MCGSDHIISPRLKTLRAPRRLGFGVYDILYLGPVVSHRVGEDLPAVVEGALVERLVQQLGALELGARVLVPEGVGAVGAHRGQRAVRRVERDVVHGVDVLQHGPAVARAGLALPPPAAAATYLAAPRRGRRAVALEREVVLGVGRVHVLDGDAALHAAEREAGRLLGLLVAEDGDAAVLVLERGLHALELGRLHALQRVEVDAAVGRAHRRQRVVLGVQTFYFTTLLN